MILKHRFQVSLVTTKNIINRVLSSEENFNHLLVRPPASSKTQFLMEIMKARNGKNCVYFDATNTTNRKASPRGGKTLLASRQIPLTINLLGTISQIIPADAVIYIDTANSPR